MKLIFFVVICICIKYAFLIFTGCNMLNVVDLESNVTLDFRSFAGCTPSFYLAALGVHSGWELSRVLNCFQSDVFDVLQLKSSEISHAQYAILSFELACKFIELFKCAPFLSSNCPCCD